MRAFSLFFLLLTRVGFSLLTENPWSPNLFEPRAKLAFFDQKKENVLSLGIESSFEYLILENSKPWSLELGLDFRNKTNIRAFQGQLRCHLLEDVAGDFITLTPGFSFSYTPRKKLFLAYPTRSKFLAETTVGFGKELSFDSKRWDSRAFSLFSFGLTSNFKPFGRANVTFEKHLFKGLTAAGFARGTTLATLLVGGSLDYQTERWGLFKVTASKECIKKGRVFSLEYVLPFGL